MPGLAARFRFDVCPTALDLPFLEKAAARQEPLSLTGMKKEEIRPLLIDMLKREDELRLHSKVQEVYSDIGDDETELSIFTEVLQKHVCHEFMVDPSIGIELIRCAVSLFPKDEEIKNIPHYVRHNRCFEGNLKNGDVPPNCRVAQLNGNACNLLDLVDIQRPVVLLGASHT